MADDVFSEYPCLIVGDKIIQKDNILVFLKKVTDLNDKFKGDPNVNKKGREQQEKMKRLEIMCQTQLHLVTVSKNRMFILGLDHNVKFSCCIRSTTSTESNGYQEMPLVGYSTL